MRVGFSNDCQVISSSEIKKPVGGDSRSYLASMLFLQCSPPSFTSSNFPSFGLIPPSLSGVHLHVCLVPVVIALLCQSVTKSKMFSGNEILSLSQSFITFYLRVEFFDTESYCLYLHTSQQRWRSILVLVALFWENYLQKLQILQQKYFTWDLKEKQAASSTLM